MRIPCASDTTRPARRLAQAAVLATFLALPIAAASPSGAATTIDGTTAGGAPYSITVPDDWNGDLVVYAHGIVDPGLPVAAPTDQDGFNLLRDHLLDMKFAVAASGYGENGYAIKEGAQNTHQLTGLFTSKFGQPGRIYLVGHSLGAAIEQYLVETFPGQYDGALLMCGLLGGSAREVDYLGNERVLFDYFFPGAAPGDILTIPEGIDFSPGSPAFLAVYAALTGGFAPPYRTLEFGGTGWKSNAWGETLMNLHWQTPEELVATGLSIVGFSLRFGNNVLDLTHGHGYFDNTGTTYSGSSDDEALNDDIARFSASADAQRYIENYYTPTGRLQIPVVTLHTTRDPVVPFEHEAAYAGLVADADASALLYQRSVEAWGHCAFSADDMMRAFADLRAWVETGARPADGGEPLP